jgi:hypothetical protein
MSHVARVNCQIKLLDALSTALEKFPGTALQRGQTKFQYYGGSKEACIHAITVPGTKYEIGLRYKATDPAEGFEPVCDFFDGKIAQTFGRDLIGLRNEYSAVVAEQTLRRRGYRVQRAVDTREQIRLVATQ